MRDVESTLQDRLASLVTAMGYEFVGCEIQRHSRRSVLRIYIDSEQGIKLDDCSKVSYQVSAMLDVEDPIKGEYTLEISSPGVDRPLFEIAHYQKYIGSRVKVRVHNPIEGRRNFVGVLLRVQETDIHLLMDAGEEVVLPFSTIERAKVVA